MLVCGVAVQFAVRICLNERLLINLTNFKRENIFTPEFQHPSCIKGQREEEFWENYFWIWKNNVAAI